MSKQIKMNDKAILIPHQDGPLCPALIMDITEDVNKRQIFKGVYFNGSGMQTFSVSDGLAGVQIIAGSPMLEALIDELGERIEQERESYELSLKRTVKLKEVFFKYFG